MGNQWVRDVVTIAEAVVVTDLDSQIHGTSCRFCGCRAEFGKKVLEHAPDCPVTLAVEILTQAQVADDEPVH